MALLEIKNLKVDFHGEGGVNHAVDGVSLSLEKGRIMGLVGESGCGKSVTAMSVLRLVPDPPGRIVGGEIHWKGTDLLRLPLRKMPAIRGREVAMIFQDPMASLNPVFTIRRILGEIIYKRFGEKGKVAEERLVKALSDVGIPDPASRLSAYPHELSGGQKQRVMVALALLSDPELLIADEPTTALDVTIQKQILHLFKEMRERIGMAILLITHNIAVVAETCDDVAVMYAGRIVEKCTVTTMFEKPAHPYTRGLLDSVPTPGQHKSVPLRTIEGTVPSLFDPPKGCRFADRCSRVEEKCRTEDPQLHAVGDNHEVACHFPLQEGDKK
ncbi:MAG: ABC transporter ATP-binding protein [Candidatus Sumerlaeia bacterium]|nr:ABC transporter ATP-binding protein [Candidatus Sumerlaeia bacterium]